MSEYGLGWKPPVVRDPRNWKLPQLIALVESGQAQPVVTWDISIGPLNQGKTNHCVGFAGAAFIAAAQTDGSGDATVTDALGHELYYACKDKEGIYDGHPQREEGTSVHSLMRVLKDRGIISAYAFGGFSDKQDWEYSYGSTVVGTNWYEGMMTPQPDGSLAATGPQRGGHGYLSHGVNHIIEVGPASLNRNSWDGWGRIEDMPGDFYMHNILAYRLIDQENGECAMAVKAVVRPKPGVAGLGGVLALGKRLLATLIKKRKVTL